MHTTDYSPPSARRAARPAATDDFALAVLVHLLLIEPYLAGGRAGGRRETAPGLMTAQCERPRSSR
jgi:hypothetical protein